MPEIVDPMAYTAKLSKESRILDKLQREPLKEDTLFEEALCFLTPQQRCNQAKNFR